MRGRERHISWGRLQVATSPFEKNICQCPLCITELCSVSLESEGGGGGKRGIRRTDVPRSRLWYAKLVVVVLVGFPSSSYWIIQIIMLPKNEMTLPRERGRETEASLQVVGNISYIYLQQSVVIALIAIHYSDSATACFKLIIIYAIYDMCMCVCVCDNVATASWQNVEQNIRRICACWFRSRLWHFICTDCTGPEA